MTRSGSSHNLSRGPPGLQPRRQRPDRAEPYPRGHQLHLRRRTGDVGLHDWRWGGDGRDRGDAPPCWVYARHVVLATVDPGIDAALPGEARNQDRVGTSGLHPRRVAPEVADPVAVCAGVATHEEDLVPVAAGAPPRGAREGDSVSDPGCWRKRAGFDVECAHGIAAEGDSRLQHGTKASGPVAGNPDGWTNQPRRVERLGMSGGVVGEGSPGVGPTTIGPDRTAVGHQLVR